MLLLDGEKAFDYVQWGWIDAVLECMRFPPCFRHLISAIYQGAQMRFKVNGHLSKREAQTNGVRQGCPCSPLLYIIALQPLLAMLEQDDRILGIDVPGGRVKHFSYAAQTNTLHYFSSLLLPRAVRRLHPDAVRRRLPRHASPPPPQPARVCVVSTPVAWASRIRFAGARPREVVGCALLVKKEKKKNS